MYSELLGYFESEINPKDKEYIARRIFFKKGSTYMVNDLLSRC
jgi:hypothetical protein